MHPFKIALFCAMNLLLVYPSIAHSPAQKTMQVPETMMTIMFQTDASPQSEKDETPSFIQGAWKFFSMIWDISQANNVLITIGVAWFIALVIILVMKPEKLHYPWWVHFLGAFFLLLVAILTYYILNYNNFNPVSGPVENVLLVYGIILVSLYIAPIIGLLIRNYFINLSDYDYFKNSPKYYIRIIEGAFITTTIIIAAIVLYTVNL